MIGVGCRYAELVVIKSREASREYLLAMRGEVVKHPALGHIDTARRRHAVSDRGG